MRGRGRSGFENAVQGASIRKVRRLPSAAASVQRHLLYPAYPAFLPMKDGSQALREAWQEAIENPLEDQARGLHYHDVWTSFRYRTGYAYAFGLMHEQLGNLDQPRLTSHLIQQMRLRNVEGLSQNILWGREGWENMSVARSRAVSTLAVLRTFAYQDRLPIFEEDTHDTALFALLAGARSLANRRHELISSESSLTDPEIAQWRQVERSGSALSAYRVAIATTHDPGLWNQFVFAVKDKIVTDKDIASMVQTQLDMRRKECLSARDDLAHTGLSDEALDMTRVIEDCDNTREQLGWPIENSDKVPLHEITQAWDASFATDPNMGQPMTTVQVIAEAHKGHITPAVLEKALADSQENRMYAHSLLVLHTQGIPQEAQEMMRFGGSAFALGSMCTHGSAALSRLEYQAYTGTQSPELSQLRVQGRAALIFAQGQYLDLVCAQKYGHPYNKHYGEQLSQAKLYQTLPVEFEALGGDWKALAKDIDFWHRRAISLYEKTRGT